LKRLLGLFTLFLLLSAGCRKGSPSWDTGIVTPLAHASLSINNLLTDSLLTAGPDGSIRLVYSTKFLGLSTDTLFDIPDTTIVNSYNSPFTLNLSNGQNLFSNQATQTTYALGGVELVNGILSAGQIIMSMKNDIRLRVIVSYTIPGATRNGDPFDTMFVLPAAPDSLNGSVTTAVIDLSGYTVDFTGINHDRVNTLTTYFSAQLDPTEQAGATVYYGDTVSLSNTITGIRPYYVRGYFGNETVTVGPEETSFSLFSRITSGALGLDSLKMSLHLDNYVGMDSRVTINSIWSRNSRTGQSVYLQNSLIGTPINVNRATYSNSWPPVNPSSYNFVFDNSNSNAKSLVENLPDKLGYEVTLLTNPLGNVSGNNDFFFADYGINGQLDVEMPLNFYASQLAIADTIEPNFSSLNNKSDIVEGTLTLYAQNSFPFDASVQIYLLDANGQITDSIVALPNTILSGGVANVSNYMVSSGFTSSQLNIPLNPAQTQALLNSTRLIMKAVFETNSAPSYVKVFSSNRLDLQLTADFVYHIGD
jgi:hypothetical protein